MNVPNMKKLRTRLRSNNNPVGFNMSKWFWHNNRHLHTPSGICKAAETHPCGTAACLAGHAALLAWQSGEAVKSRRRVAIGEIARDWLEITEIQASRLFFGHWSPSFKSGKLASISKASAIRELTRLIDLEENKRGTHEL